MPLESKNVFIDTSIIVKNNFQFTFGKLKQLRDLAKDKRIIIYLSDIVVSETRKKIRERAGEATQKYKKFMKSEDAWILKNLDNSEHAVPRTLKTESIVEFLMEQFNQFMDDCHVQLLTTDQIMAGPILKRFFNVEPPFGTGKKHSEFRDAFNMEAIRQWVNDNSKIIYVLAGDSDLEKACEKEQKIHYIKEVADYLKMVNETDNPDEAAKLETLLPAVYQHLLQQLEESFPQLDFFLEDEEGEVLDITVNKVQIFLYPLNLSKGEAIFDFMAEVDYSAHVVYDDPDMTYYDKEEDQRIALEQIDETLNRDAKIQGQVFVSVDDADPSGVSLTKIEVEERSIPVQVTDTSEYPYK